MKELDIILRTKLKQSTGILFSEDIYLKILKNEEITINSLFADKTFQSHNIYHVKKTLDQLEIKSFLNWIEDNNLQRKFIVNNLEVLQKFEELFKLMLQDFIFNKVIFQKKVENLFEINKASISKTINKESFMEQMLNLPDSVSIRVLNIVYLDNSYITTQSFDKHNIEQFYN